MSLSLPISSPIWSNTGFLWTSLTKISPAKKWHEWLRGTGWFDGLGYTNGSVLSQEKRLLIMSKCAKIFTR
jgi:hypothetical protein